MSISQIRKNARTALAGKWGKGAVITLAYFAFFFAIGFVIGLFGEDSPMGSLLNLASSIIQVPVLFGLSYAFIKLKRNEEVKAFDFLNIGFSNFGRAWKISLRTLLKMILPIIVVVVAVILFTFGLTAYIMSGSSTLLVVSLIVYIIALIFTVAVALLYALTTFIAYDNPNMSSLEVVNESAKMMKGNRGKVILLELSFIGWAILSVVTLGIGYFWLMPYMMVAEICFYEHLLGNKEEKNSEDNGEAITEY